jgi:iduronate 2-sulfatase
MSGAKKSGGMDRRAFLAASAMAAPLAAATLAASPLQAPAIATGTTKKRNVLFICCDDLTPRIGSFGDPVAKTPSLDRLSHLGVRFERNYCQYPLCGPSRTSLMTGLAPDTTQVWDLKTDFRDTIPDAVTLPQLFHQNGYFTARAGKIYHYNNSSEIGTPGFDDAASWQVATYPAGYDRTHDEELVTFYVSEEAIVASAGKAQNFEGKPHLSDRRRQSEVRWSRGGKGPGGIRLAQDGRTPILPLSRNGDLGVPIAGHASEGTDEMMTDFMVAESAIAMIEEHRSDPWFIGSGFFRPHVPFIVPSKYFDLYSLDEMAIPPLTPDELKAAPQLAYLSMNANYGMTERQHREAMRAHFAAISFVDAQVGRLLDALTRLELLDNTAIVFWSDHGFMVGEHGQWEKRMLFEASAHVPLVLAGAGVPAKGKACRRTVEHLNLYPTLAEMCGLEKVPSYLQGKSMLPLLSNPDGPWDRPAMTQVGRTLGSVPVMGYSLRSERYRYTMWGNGGAEGEELYDYDADPREVKNLAKDSNSAGIKAKLRMELERICAARRVPGDVSRNA